MSVAQANRSVRWEPSEIIDHAGVMVVTRGSTIDRYCVTEIVGQSPRRFLLSRSGHVGPDTAASRAAASRTDTYTCSPSAKACTCAAGNIALVRGSDSSCVHVLALSKLLQIGALPDPMERPSDVQNTELHEQEPVIGTMYDPMDEYADIVELSEFIAL